MNKNIFVITFFLAVCSCSSKTTNDSFSMHPASINILLLKELNTSQIGSLDKKKTAVLIPGGILEEHGPYLPSFTDGYWNEKLTDTLAKAIAAKKDWKVIIFPTIPLGNSGANDVGLTYSFPGTYTVRFETLRAIFMDLATELGEQGFQHVFIIHGHGAPNHHRALDQATDFFNETYGGRMVNLMGLTPVMLQWFEAPKTKDQEREDGFTIHAGVTETSSMVYIASHLVDSGYKNAVPFTGSSMEDLFQIAQRPDWKGYFGSPRLATAAFGKKAWHSNARMFTQYALDMLDGRLNPDTLQHFGDYSKENKTDAILDSLSLKEEQRRKDKQESWLRNKGLQ